MQEEGSLNTPDDNDIGYCIEGDLEIPEHLPDKFKEFPPCPESLTPQIQWLSSSQKFIMKQNNIHPSSCPKFIPHLMNHEKYVIHYRNLNYILSLGVKLTKIHRVFTI